MLYQFGRWELESFKILNQHLIKIKLHILGGQTLILYFALVQKRGHWSSITERVKEKSHVFLSMERKSHMVIGILTAYLLPAQKINFLQFQISKETQCKIHSLSRQSLPKSNGVRLLTPLKKLFLQLLGQSKSSLLKHQLRRASQSVLTPNMERLYSMNGLEKIV